MKNLKMEEPALFTKTDFHRLIVENIQTSERWKIDRESVRHQLAIGFYISILEQSDSIRVLVEASKAHDATIILRSSFEHLLALLHITSSATDERQYVRAFTAKNTMQIKNALGGNPYLDDLARLSRIGDDLEDNERRLETYKENKIHSPPSVEELAKKHGFHHEYESVYRNLSDVVHPSYAGIIRRCMKIDDKRSDHSIVGFQEPDQVLVDLVIDTSARILVDAEASASSFFDKSKNEDST